MKRSLFSPLNIIIVAAVAVIAWYYMKYIHTHEEVVQPVVVEEVIIEEPAEEASLEEADESTEAAEEVK